MKSSVFSQLIEFLRHELAIPESAIALALPRCSEFPSSLAMVLWQYGLVNLQQLDLIFEWLDTATTTRVL